MITVLRIIQVGTRNFLRNAWLSTAATAVMTVTLTVILLSYILTSTFNDTTKQIVNKVDVSIYLKNDVTEEQVKDLQSQVLKIDNVASARLITKAEALARYRERYKNNPTLLNSISETDNPLPQSFDVKVKDQKKLASLEEFVNRPEVKGLLDAKTPTSYQGENKQTVDKIVRVSNFLNTSGLISSLIFTIISTLIIFNTIRMAIFTRRQEIEIMKLVGATNWFIRGPFLFEAALYGIIGSVVAVSLGYLLLLVGGPKLAGYAIEVGPIIEYFRTNPFLIIGIELFIGMIIGGISSLLAMSRYLKLE
jgi:cell division transport system permease protein